MLLKCIQYENKESKLAARLLMSYTDKDDVCDDFSDLVPRQTSAFEQLFLERENMVVRVHFLLLKLYCKSETGFTKAPSFNFSGIDI